MSLFFYDCDNFKLLNLKRENKSTICITLKIEHKFNCKN